VDGEWITVAAAAERLGLTEEALRYLVDNGVLDADEDRPIAQGLWVDAEAVKFDAEELVEAAVRELGVRCRRARRGGQTTDGGRRGGTAAGASGRLRRVCEEGQAAESGSSSERLWGAAEEAIEAEYDDEDEDDSLPTAHCLLRVGRRRRGATMTSR
jgi:hypothetical protein